MDTSLDTFAEKDDDEWKVVGLLVFPTFFFFLSAWNGLLKEHSYKIQEREDSKRELVFSALESWHYTFKKQGVKLDVAVLIAFLLLTVGLPSGPVVEKNLHAM